MSERVLLVPQLDAAKNQALCRDANDQILEGRRREGLSSAEFLCECPDLDCPRKVTLGLDEYEAVRLVPTHFVVACGHADRGLERVVADHAEYTVVEKFGPGGIAAIRLSRRA